jgi:calcineurin-like phosphoesterase family protein
MSKIWLTSDLHFCHDKDFIYQPRGFKSVHEMNEAIVQNFNEIVAWDDDLWILGDCFLNNNEEGMELMEQLPGNKFVIYGNHDSMARQKLLCGKGWEVWYADIPKYKGYQFYLSHYPTITSNLDVDKPLKCRVISLCGHVHTQDKFLDMDKG